MTDPRRGDGDRAPLWQKRSPESMDLQASAAHALPATSAPAMAKAM
jgi:hypothetical protein